MIRLQDSVGTGGVNKIKDVQSVQLGLLKLQLLSRTQFIEEGLQAGFNHPLESIQNEIMAGNTDVSKAFDLLHSGEGKIEVSKLSATIKAIRDLQEREMKMNPGSGLVKVKSATLKTINALLKQQKLKTSPGPAGPPPFDIQLNKDKIHISLRAQQTEKTKVVALSKARDYIINNYNWNGIVKLMQFVYQKNEDKYVASTQLSGTPSDNALIIPDQSIIYIIRLQLSFLIRQHGLKAHTLNLILNDPGVGVDGKAGPSFIRKVIKAKDMTSFFDEAPNKNRKRLEDGAIINIPNSKDDEAVLYHFCRDICRCRNGLWSDLPGVTNVIGFRRPMDVKEGTRFNDTIAVCWRELASNGQHLLRTELNIATTEPGDRATNNELTPQCLTLLPGYHKNRQPAGRTHNGVQLLSSGTLKWIVGDTTMNFHQGKNNFTYPRNEWLTPHGIDWKLKTGMPNDLLDEKTLRDLNLLFSKLYLILSKYGQNKANPAYTNLKAMAKVRPIVVEGIKDGNVNVKQGNRKKQIPVEKSRQYLLDTWYRKRKENRSKILEILKALSDYDPKVIDTWKDWPKEKIKPFIKDEHISRMVELQAGVMSDINDSKLDGLAGNSFIQIIRGVFQPLAAAKEDLQKVDELLAKLADFPLKKLTELRSILKSMRIYTESNRRSVFLNTNYNTQKDVPFIQNVTVGIASQGCQVIYDTEVFYTFWTKLLALAAKSGQTRWYYSLIEASQFKRSDLV